MQAAAEPGGRVEQVLGAGRHLLSLINDVLDLSRIESGNLRMALETLNMPELLASMDDGALTTALARTAFAARAGFDAGFDEADA